MKISLYKPLVGNIKNAYVIASVVVILIVVCTQLNTHSTIKAMHQHGKVFNLAERQRMLSEQLARLVLKIKEDHDEKAVAEISEVNREWTELHQSFRHASENSNLSSSQYEEVTRLLQNIQPHKDRISQVIITLLNVNMHVDELNQMEATQPHVEAYLLLIEELAEKWQRIDEDTLQQTLDRQLAEGVIVLVISGCLLYLLLLPISQDLKKKNNALKVAYQEQEELNKELSAAKEKLQQALEYQTEISHNLEEAKRKAEEASKAKEQFLSTMSHEIRTPMNAVTGLTYLLLEDAPKPSQVENLQALKFAGDTLLSLINDILDFSKIESGKIELEETEFNLKYIFKGMKQSLGVNAVEKGIALNCHYDSDIPEVLIGDPTRLSQVLNNLVSNAIKFTLHGEVNLTAALDHITDENAAITFTVQDTGIGIAEDKLEEIFESFTQASKDISRKYGGTGLGLAISKKLLEIQHSQIKVESKVNQGSTFTFTLVFKYRHGEIDHHATTLNRSMEFGLKGANLLVAEDSNMNVLVIRQFLDKWGVSFHVVHNGQLAVEAARKQIYDLILMDLQMPDMDGFTAAMEIREFNQQVPIIALTASALLEVQKNVYAAGMNDFATKPFIPGELYSKIEKHIRSLS